MDGITAFWMVGLNKVVCDCVLWQSGSHWYAVNWKSCNVCRIFSVKAIFETRESRPKLISSTREQNFQKCPALLFVCLFVFCCLFFCLFFVFCCFFFGTFRGNCTQTKIENVLCAISKLSTHFWKLYYQPEAKYLRNSKMALKFEKWSNSWLTDQNMQISMCLLASAWS